MADNVKVAIKVRPLIQREKLDNLTVLWEVKNESIYPKDNPDQKYAFDHIFDINVPTSEVFDKIARPIVDAAVNGINGTLFAYGQTASGKTYTMMGTKEEPGVITLAVLHIFQNIQNSSGREFLLRVSYLELYNEKLRDLLSNDGQDLKIREDMSGDVTVKCREEVTNSPDHVLEIMQKGNKNRKIGETNMNERSSRSHTIFRIIIESRDADKDGDQAIQVSHLNLVDLAGSERAHQTCATGVRLKEGSHINKSLLALSQVIKHLSESGADGDRFINYRDSKLTRLLQTSLGGNAMTGIICAVTPVTLDETHSTLHFASTAKNIKNKPKVNEVMSDTALLKRMAMQLAKLNQDLEKAKCNESTSNRRNEDLMERIKRLEETILLSGSSDNTIKQSSNSSKNRRRTWCAGPSAFRPMPTITEASPVKTRLPVRHQSIRQHSSADLRSLARNDSPVDDTPFEEFELDLLKTQEELNQSHMITNPLEQISKHITIRESNNLFSISEISEGDSRRTSFESDFSLIDLDQAGDDIFSPVKWKKKLCCSKEDIISQATFSPENHDTPCKLRRALAAQEQEYITLRDFTILEKQICIQDLRDAQLTVTKLKIENSLHQEQLKSQHDEIINHKTKISVLEQLIKTKDEIIDEITMKFNNQTQTLNDSEIRISNLIKLDNTNKTIIDDLQSKISELEISLRATKEMCENTKTESINKTHYISKLETEIEAMVKSDNNKNVILDQLHRKISDLEELVETEEKRLKEIEVEHNNETEILRLEIDTEKQTLNELKLKMSNMVELDNHKNSLIEKLQSKVDEFEILLKETNEVCDKLKQEHIINSDRISNLQDEVDAKEKVNNDKTILHDQLHAKISDLEELLKTKENKLRELEVKFSNEAELVRLEINNKNLQLSEFEHQINNMLKLDCNKNSVIDELQLKINELEELVREKGEMCEKFKNENMSDLVPDHSREEILKLKELLKNKEGTLEQVEAKYNNMIELLQLEIADRNQQLNEFEDQISKMVQLDSNKNTIIEELQSKINEVEMLLNEKKEVCDKLQHESIAKTDSISNLEAEISAMVKLGNSKESIIGELQEKISKLEELLITKEEQKELEVNCNNLVHTHNELENQLNNKDTTIDELHTKIREMEGLLKEKEESLQNAEIEFNNVTSVLMRDIEKKIQIISDLQDQITKNEECGSGPNKECLRVDELHSKIQELEQILALKEESWEKYKIELLNETKTLKCEINEKVHRISDLENEIAILTKPKSGLTSDLQDSEMIITFCERLQKETNELECCLRSKIYTLEQMLNDRDKLNAQLINEAKVLADEGVVKTQLISELENKITEMTTLNDDKQVKLLEELHIRADKCEELQKKVAELSEGREQISQDIDNISNDICIHNDHPINNQNLDKPNPVLEFENLINTAKSKYDEITSLLDDMHKSELNCCSLQDKLQEVQLLNEQCRKGCEKLREELQQKFVASDVFKSQFSRSAALFEQSLILKNESLENIRENLSLDLQGKVNEVTEYMHIISNDKPSIINENSYLKSRLKIYKDLIVSMHKDLKDFKQLVIKLKFKLMCDNSKNLCKKITDDNFSETKFDQFDTTEAESTFDSKYLLADNTFNISDYDNTLASTTIQNDLEENMHSTLKCNPSEDNLSKAINNSTIFNAETSSVDSVFEKSELSVTPVFENTKLAEDLNQATPEFKLSTMISSPLIITKEHDVEKLESINMCLKTELREVKLKYAELSTQLEQMKHEVHGDNFDQLQLINSELEIQLQKLKDEKSHLEQVISDWSNKYDELQRKYITENNDINQHNINGDVHDSFKITEVDNLENIILNNDVTIELHDEFEHKDNESSKLQENDINTNLNILRRKLNELSNYNLDLEAKFNNLLKTTKSSEDFNKLLDQNRELQSDVDKYISVNNTLNKEIEYLRLQNVEQGANSEDAENTNEKHYLELAELKKRIIVLQREMERIQFNHEEQISELQLQIAELETETDKANLTKSSLIQELDMFKLEHSKFDNKSIGLQNQHHKNDKENEQLTTIKEQELRILKLTTINTEMCSELNRIQKTNADLRQEISSFTGISKYNEDIDDLQLQNAELETDISKLQLVNDNLNKELIALKEKCNCSHVSSTEQNVNLMINEICPIDNDLKAINESMMIEISDLKCTNHQLETQINSLRSQINPGELLALKSEIDEYKLNFNKQQSLNAELNNEISIVKQKNSELEIQITDLKEKMVEIEQENDVKINNMNKELHEMKLENSVLTQEVQSKCKNLDDMKNEKIRIENEHANLKLAAEKLHTDYDSLMLEKLDVETALGNAISEYNGRTIRESSAELEINDLENQLKCLRQMLKDKDEEIEQYSFDKSELLLNFETANNNYEQLKNEMQLYVMQTEYNAVVAENAKLAIDLEQAIRNKESSLKEIVELREDLKKLQEERNSLLDQVEKLKAESMDMSMKLEILKRDLEASQTIQDSKTKKGQINDLTSDNTKLLFEANSLSNDLKEIVESSKSMTLLEDNNSELARLKICLAEMSIEISTVKNNMLKDLGNFDKANIVKDFKDLTLQETFDVYIKFIIHKESEMFSEIQHQLSKSKSWISKLEQENDLLNDENGKLRKYEKDTGHELQEVKKKYDDLMKAYNDKCTSETELTNVKCKDDVTHSKSGRNDFLLALKDSAISTLNEQNENYIKMNMDLKNEIQLEKAKYNDIYKKYGHLQLQFNDINAKYETLALNQEQAHESKELQQRVNKLHEESKEYIAKNSELFIEIEGVKQINKTLQSNIDILKTKNVKLSAIFEEISAIVVEKVTDDNLSLNKNQRNNEVTTESNSLTGSVVLMKVKHLKDHVETLIQKNETIANEHEDLLKKYSELSKSKNEQERNLNTFVHDNTELKKKFDEKLHVISAQDEELIAVNNEIKILQEKCTNLVHENEKLMIKIDQAGETIQSMKLQENIGETTKHELDVTVVQLNKDIQILNEKLEESLEINSKLQEKVKKHTHNETELRKCKNEVVKLRSELEKSQLMQEDKVKDEEVKKVEIEILELQKVIEDLEIENKELKYVISGIEVDNQKLRSENVNISTKLQALEELQIQHMKYVDMLDKYTKKEKEDKETISTEMQKNSVLNINLEKTKQINIELERDMQLLLVKASGFRNILLEIYIALENNSEKSQSLENCRTKDSSDLSVDMLIKDQILEAGFASLAVLIKKLKDTVQVLTNRNDIIEKDNFALKRTAEQLEYETDRKVLDLESQLNYLLEENTRINLVLEEKTVALKKYTNQETELCTAKIELNDLQEKFNNVIHENDKLKKALETSTVQKPDQQVQLETAMQQNKNIRMKLSTAVNCNSELKKELVKVRSQFQTNEMEVHSLRKALQEKSQYMDQHLAQVAMDSKRDTSKLQKIILDHKMENHKLRNKMLDYEHLKSENNRLSEQLSTCENRLSKITIPESNSPKRSDMNEDITKLRQQNDKLLKENDILRTKIKSCACSSKEDDRNRLLKELEGARNCAAEAKKKMTEQKEKIQAQQIEIDTYKTKLERSEEDKHDLDKECDDMADEIKRYKSVLNELHGKIKSLEAKKETEIKNRRRSLHDSIRNLPDASDTADKCLNTEPDEAMIELKQKLGLMQCTITNLKMENDQSKAKLNNQLDELKKRNDFLHAKNTENSKELRRMHSLLQENTIVGCSAIQDQLEPKDHKTTQTETLGWPENTSKREILRYKEKYENYKKLSIMRANEIKELKSDLKKLGSQNKENNTP